MPNGSFNEVVAVKMNKNSSLVLKNVKEAIECPVCYNIPQGHVVQCENGHLLCALCRSRIPGKCPTCM